MSDAPVSIKGYKNANGDYIVIIDDKEFVLGAEVPEEIADPVLVTVVRGTLSTEYGTFQAGDVFTAERARATEFALTNRFIDNVGSPVGVQVSVSEIP